MVHKVMDHINVVYVVYIVENLAINIYRRMVNSILIAVVQVVNKDKVDVDLDAKEDIQVSAD